MDLNAIPLFAMMKAKMTHTAERQRVISLNIANSDVPDYSPRDLKPFSFDQQLRSMQTNPMLPGMQGMGVQAMGVPQGMPGYIPTPDTPADPSSKVSLASVDSPDSEVRLDGNHVVLEEQMSKMGEAQGDYAAAVSYYEQSLSLLKMALQKPGG